MSDAEGFEVDMTGVWRELFYAVTDAMPEVDARTRKCIGLMALSGVVAKLVVEVTPTQDHLDGAIELATIQLRKRIISEWAFRAIQDDASASQAPSGG